MGKRTALAGACGRIRGRPVLQTQCFTWAEAWLPPHPVAAALLIALLCHRRNGHMGAQVTAVGCLASLTYYYGQRDVGTGVMHHHNAVKALFAGFRHRCISFYILARSLFSSAAEVAAS